MAEGFRDQGVSEEQIEQFIREHDHDEDEPEEIFEYWHDIGPVIEAFWKVRRYWQRAGINALPVGLQPEAVNMVLTKLGHGDDFDLFEDIMTIGDGAAEAIRAQYDHG